MKIKESLNRFQWRLSSGKSFQPNENDISAFNEIIKYYNKKEEKQLEDHSLFGKLYIYMFKHLIKHYKTTVFDPIPQKELHKILDTDINYLVEDFKDSVNEQETYNFLSSLGIKTQHPLLVSEEEKEQEVSKIKEMLKKEGVDRFKGDVWDIKSVKEILNVQINGALNNYR